MPALQNPIVRSLLGCAAVVASFAATSTASAQITGKLIISEYVEGSSYNKALELFNGTPTAIDLATVSIVSYTNGKTTGDSPIALTGTLAPGDAFVIANPNAAPEIVAAADVTSTRILFNGNDALVLMQGGVAIDHIGQVGNDPSGGEWGTGLTSTMDNTLRRTNTTCPGDVATTSAVNLSASGWAGYALNTFDGLGSHMNYCLKTLQFSEYVEGSSYEKAIEIYNGTPNTVSLSADGYTLKTFFNGQTSGTALALSGTIEPGKTFVVASNQASATLKAYAQQLAGQVQFNGDDAVTLEKNGVVIDTIGQVGFDPGTEWGTGLTSTMDNTLRRKASICKGDANVNNVFDPAGKWIGDVTNAFSGLGFHTHTVACTFY